MSIEAIRELGTLASVCPELNMANYGEDDVRHLNNWAIEMSLLAEKVTAAPQPAQATQADVTDAEIVAVMRDGNNCNYNDEAEHVQFARAILALRPERVPMTEHQVIGAALHTPPFSLVDYMCVVSFEAGVRAAEAHHDITAQAKKEGE